MSLTIDFHAKLSGHEAKEWIRNCLTAMGHTHDDEEKLIDFISQHKPKDLDPVVVAVVEIKMYFLQ